MEALMSRENTKRQAPEWAPPVKAWIANKGITQKQFAEEYLGLTPEHFSSLITGRQYAREETLEKISKIVGISLSLLRLGGTRPNILTDQYAGYGLDDSPYYPVSFISARPAAGQGSLILEKTIISHLSFRKDWLINKGNPNSMVCMKVWGESMDPTIPNESVVLIDESQTSIYNNRIYLISTDDGLRIKRLFKDGNKIYIKSDSSPEEKTEVRVGDHFEVHGRVLWYCMEV